MTPAGRFPVIDVDPEPRPGICIDPWVLGVQVEHFAGSLLLPYVIWLAFANVLNYRCALAR